MDWKTMLPTKRTGKDRIDPIVSYRSPFEIDADRIMFSDAFRRLGNKTQVHGTSGSDYVRTRLTHSIEASRIARSLGAYIGRTLVEKAGPACPYDAGDVGHVAAAAALAHDLGNPPFGHTGEDLISDFFRDHPVGKRVIAGVGPQMAVEATHFEGNAQGFRILTRLQGWRPEGGLQMTAAVLGAFSKYPFMADAAVGPARRSLKHGFYGTEAEMFREIADECGMVPGLRPYSWKRHPLAHIVEASDDIAYRLVDLEDAAQMGILTYAEVEEMLLAIAGGNASLEYKAICQPSRRIVYLRSQAIERLIHEVRAIYLDNADAIIDGSFPGDLVMLTGVGDLLRDIAQMSFDRIYNNERRREIDLTASRVIEVLLESHCEAFEERERLGGMEGISKRSELIIRSFPHAGKVPISDREAWLRAVLDFISGMTDTFASKRAQQLRGTF